MEGHPWACNLCGKNLSRKQRLQTHVKRQHPEHFQESEQARGIYKRYEIDENIPVPKRSRIRHRSQTVNQQNIESSSQHNSSNQYHATLVCEDIERQYHDEGNEIFNREKCMAVLSYINRMKLSGTASEHLLRLLKILTDDKDIDANLKTIFSDIHPKTVDYCVKCGVEFVFDESVYKCITEGCDELRYLGPLEKQHQKRRKCYFSVVSVAQQLKEILGREGMLQRIKSLNISLTMNTDGVPLYNSSSVSLWPVLFTINDLPPTERFLTQNLVIWGLWQGCGKPSFKSYLNPLVDELNSLYEEGMSINGQTIKVTMTCCTMDLQAKAQVMEMVQHNGEYGCVSCEEPGKVFKQGKGHCRGYPLTDSVPQIRSVDSLISNAEEAIDLKCSVKGIKSVSVLFGLRYFDPVKSVVPDYMHGVLLGTTKKLISMWFGKATSKEPFHLGKFVKDIDKRLTNMKPIERISRLPRKIEGNICHWKASELQHWLLYYSVPCVLGYMKQEYLDNLSYLVEGIYLLLGDTISEEDLSKAEMSLTMFQISFQTLYGKQNCGLNIHNIGCHLVQYVRYHGPLWAWSCFGFEDLNGFLIKSSHGTGDVSKQLLTSLFAKKQLCKEVDDIQNLELKDFIMDMLSTGRRFKSLTDCNNCQIAGNIKQSTDDTIAQQVMEVLNLTERPVISTAARVRLQNGQMVTSKLYTRQQKRVCYAVVTSKGDIGLVNYFLHENQSDKCLAHINKLEIIGFLNPNISHLLRTEETNDQEIIPVNEILELVLFLDGNQGAVCISRLPNFYGHCG